MKTILVFKRNNLMNQINFKTKTEAKKTYNLFLKHGMIDKLTGLKIEGLTFELI